ncbi:MAG: GNAT family N-acetyltransferase [Anaerolineales bacterium]|nr:MAG: GNAT family N-acetyltransferase [Anaerolineales bacterium]
MQICGAFYQVKMNHKIRINPIQPANIQEAMDLVRRVFLSSVASEYSSQGIDEFFGYANAESMRKRLGAHDFALAAYLADKIVGLIEVRNNDHISLLFVDDPYQHEGIGRALCQHAIGICKENGPAIQSITVNASPNAVTAYRHIGFLPMEEEQLVNGIRYIPMRLNL